MGDKLFVVDDGKKQYYTYEKSITDNNCDYDKNKYDKFGDDFCNTDFDSGPQTNSSEIQVDCVMY